MAAQLQYCRILLKLSGEALLGPESSIDVKKLHQIVADLKALRALSVEVALVIGGGNILRGKTFSENNFDRVTGDQMAMLATVINALALEEACVQADIPVALFSALPVPQVACVYHRRKAMAAMAAGKIVILGGGTGNPLVTTDTTASLRAIELNADIIFKATKVKGIYSEDPHKNPNATFYSRLTYQAVIDQSLHVMDMNSILMCRDHGMPIRVFDMNEPNILLDLVLGKDKGTLVKGE